jgi:monovalent cation:H+ antiporter-2, CPA2 family
MLHLPNLIIDLALILGAAAIVGLIFKWLRQPIVLGYIIAGLLVGPNFRLFPTVVEVDSIRTWADIGVIFLLFSLGLEFSFKKLIKVGGVAVITALMGVVCTMVLGFGIGQLLGWNSMDCLFLGGLLAIASTTIIIRTFDELNVKTQKFTGIVMGVLVVEDLVAVVLMVGLSTVAVSRTFEGVEMLLSVSKLAFFLILWFVSGIFFLPTLLKRIRRLLNEETLLVVSLSLCFLMVYLATAAGFSPALGAFIMGSILAETTKAEKIEILIKPVRNLFGAIFFVSVGMLIAPAVLLEHMVPIIAATLALLIGKPIFVTIGALISGQPLKIAIQTGMSLSQIGEFSFIIASLGLTLNVTSEFLYPVAVAVSVVTTFTTPFMVRLAEPTYNLIERILPESWKSRLNRYSVGTQKVREVSDWKKLMRANVLNMLLSSVIIVTIIALTTRYLVPYASDHNWSKITTAVASLVVLSPFLWALAFRREQAEAYAHVWVNKLHRGPLMLLHLTRIVMAVFYVGFLLDQLFSPLAAITGIVITSAVLLIFSSRIRNFYARIEMRFLSNFNERENHSDQPKTIQTPWDTHLSTFALDAHSPYIGKTLAQSRIREEHGVNIASIQRGDLVINVPGRNEYLYPSDVLSVIGTDEQLKNFKSHLEHAAGEQIDLRRHPEVSLQSFTIGDGSGLIGKSIRNSGIRERTQGLVVGIERDGDRIVNPDSDLVFQPGDKIWIVGNERRIRVLSKEKTQQRQ